MHREELVKLINMMNKLGGGKVSLTIQNSDIEKMRSLKELTRMFIDELTSWTLPYEYEDEIVKFIESILEELKNTYNTIAFSDNLDSKSIKVFAICGQLIKDYQEVYNDAGGALGKELKKRFFVTKRRDNKEYQLNKINNKIDQVINIIANQFFKIK